MSDKAPPHLSDETLTELVEGTRGGRAREKALAHLRSCEACAQRHQRLVELSRLLAGGALHEPTEEELAAIRQANRAAVLASARAAPETDAVATRASAPWWRPLAMAAGVLLFGSLAVWGTLRTPGVSDPDPVGTFAARGADRAAPGGSLRVFCMDAATPRVLDEGASCPAGAALAFAVRFETAPEVLRIEFTGGAAPEIHPIEVTLVPGKEAVLPLTLTLEGEGERVVTLIGGPAPLQQRIRVGGAQ
ncbi:MAG TPA: hypothetical protein VK013_00605 [Myxococcaceae bacterium]|nr:hypothetical protein [Myxococcaceae bacterium]